MLTVGYPKCVLVSIRGGPHQTDSFPKYQALPSNLVECVKHDYLRVKIIDLGEGSLQCSTVFPSIQIP